jgi:hypothetical protein
MPQPTDANHKELKELRLAEPEIRNPKAEGRKKSEIRNPNQSKELEKISGRSEATEFARSLRTI